MALKQADVTRALRPFTLHTQQLITEHLRGAIGRLALEYERVAYAESDQGRVCAALIRKRG